MKDVHQLKTAEGNRASGSSKAFKLALATGVERQGDFCVCVFPGGNILFRLQDNSTPEELEIVKGLIAFRDALVEVTQ